MDAPQKPTAKLIAIPLHYPSVEKNKPASVHDTSNALSESDASAIASYQWEIDLAGSMRLLRLQRANDSWKTKKNPTNAEGWVRHQQNIDFINANQDALEIYQDLIKQDLYCTDKRAEYVARAFQYPDWVLENGGREEKHVLGMRYLSLFNKTKSGSYVFMAAKCFDDAALAGSGPACNELGLLFLEGHIRDDRDEKWSGKKSAKTLFYHAIAIEPAAAAAWWNIGKMYWKEGNNVLALWFFEQAERRNHQFKVSIQDWLQNISKGAPGTISTRPTNVPYQERIKNAQQLALSVGQGSSGSVPDYIHSHFSNLLYDEAVKFQRKGRNKEALFLFESSTLKDKRIYAETHYQTALRYLKIGDPQHLARAGRYLLLAARQGCSKAYEPLGDLYRRGYVNSVPDPWAALYWYRKADKEYPNKFADVIGEIEQTIPASDTPELQQAIGDFLLKAHDDKLEARKALGAAYQKLNTADADNIAKHYLDGARLNVAGK